MTDLQSTVPEHPEQKSVEKSRARRMNLEDFLKVARETVEEIFPWDLDEYLKAGNDPLVLDVREPWEYDQWRMKNCLMVPRGILENAVDEGFQDSNETLINARDREIIVVCRAGNRSLLAAATLLQMGYGKVRSLKTGLRGWADYGLELFNEEGNVATDEDTEAFFYPS